jgi:cell division protein FtsW
MADRFTFIIVVSLMSIGLIASYSLPTYLEFNKNLGEYYFVSKFALFAIVGISLMFILSRLNPEKWFNIIWRTLFYGSIIALIFMQLPAFSFMVPEINGAKRWINVGFFNIAPIEFFKIGLIGFLAYNLSNVAEIEDRFKYIKQELLIIIPFLVVLIGVSYITIFRQSDLGQTIMIWLIFIVMWFFIGANTRLFFGIILVGVLLFVYFLFQEEYRLGRFIGWLYSIAPSFILPDGANTNFDSYRQVNEAIDAIHNGGFLGTYLGNGVIKLGFFSDVHTDFVLAGLGEEIGAIGLIMITTLFFLLVKRLSRIAKLSSNLLYKLFVIGMALVIGVQFIMNGFGEVGIIPIKGITVPFVSYGGSSIIALCIGVGMVLMLSKRSAI